MNKLTLFGLLILIILGGFACSKKNEQQQNINTENLQQEQEEKGNISQEQEIDVDYDEQLKIFETNTNDSFFNPVYIFEPGKYNILESSVNIRSQPNLTGSVIGKLELHSEIEIIERAKNFQTIDRVTHYWYKIKYEDITGYIWGGFISIKTKVFDIDGKKINCYYRVSKSNRFENNIRNYYHHLVTPNDIFIYINLKRINNNVINKVYSEKYFRKYNSEIFYIRDYWWGCSFFDENDGNISLYINDSAAAGSEFIINIHGEIIYKDSRVDWL